MSTAPLRCALALLLSFGCGPSVDPRFAAADERAYAAMRAGRHAEAAERWLEAARTADSAADREEAEYRAAKSYERAGKTPEALALYDRLASGQGERAARASFDRAWLVEKHDEARGQRLLVEAIRRHPNSGLAPRALREYLARLEETSGRQVALDVCTRLADELSTTELDETLRYERALLLQAIGELPRARDAFIETATRHPYPKGALWDDSLARAAHLEEQLGRPRAAIALYERMLAEREPSSTLGSYERARYDEARFRIAELYRDKLADLVSARREFRRVYDEHTTSLLRDDALWQEALVALRSGDHDGACSTLELLVRALPDSRYASCVRGICPSAPKTGTRECTLVIPHREPER